MAITNSITPPVIARAAPPPPPRSTMSAVSYPPLLYTMLYCDKLSETIGENNESDTKNDTAETLAQNLATVSWRRRGGTSDDFKKVRNVKKAFSIVYPRGQLLCPPSLSLFQCGLGVGARHSKCGTTDSAGSIRVILRTFFPNAIHRLNNNKTTHHICVPLSACDMGNCLLRFMEELGLQAGTPEHTHTTRVMDKRKQLRCRKGGKPNNTLQVNSLP